MADEELENQSGSNRAISAGDGADSADAAEEIQGIVSSGRFRNMKDFRVQNPLPDVDQAVLDNVVTTVGPRGMTITNDLIQYANGGLVYPVPNWIGVSSIKRRKAGRAGAAKRSMVPENAVRGERWRLDQGSNTWPLYCTWDHFDWTIREEAAAERLGDPLDTSHAENANENINLLIEDQTINGLTDKDGSPMTIDGLAAPGLLSSTHTTTYSTWTGLTGKQIVDVVRGMLNTQRLHRKTGPQSLYLPGNFQSVTMDQYAAGYPKTILAALKELEYNNLPLNIKVAEGLPDGVVVMIEMSRKTVQVAVGQGPVPISWTVPPGWRRYNMIVAAMVTMVFPDYDGNYGVVVGSIA